MGGKLVKSRYVIKQGTPTSYTFKWEMLGDDGPWKPILEGKSTKGAVERRGGNTRSRPSRGPSRRRPSRNSLRLANLGEDLVHAHIEARARRRRWAHGAGRPDCARWIRSERSERPPTGR